jgi:uncharacterized protein
MSVWVVDTSPLIFLSKLDRLDLLRASGQAICVPPAVLREITGQDDGAAHQVEEARKSWLETHSVQDERLLRVLKADLGDGEAEVITLALEVDAARVVLDDLDARRFAGRLGLQTIGTLGVLLAAKLSGELPSLAVEIERLRQAGFRAAPTLVQAVLEAAGELNVPPG